MLNLIIEQYKNVILIEFLKDFSIYCNFSLTILMKKSHFGIFSIRVSYKRLCTIDKKHTSFVIYFYSSK